MVVRCDTAVNTESNAIDVDVQNTLDQTAFENTNEGMSDDGQRLVNGYVIATFNQTSHVAELERVIKDVRSNSDL